MKKFDTVATMEHDTNNSRPYPGSVPMVRIDGGKIKRLREERKLTQLYLSTVVGVTTDTISRWENRHYQSIKLENAEKLAQALEVPFEEILQREEPEPASTQEPEPQEKPTLSSPTTGETPHPPGHRLPVFFRRPLVPVLTVVLIVFLVGIAMFALFPKPASLITARRVLPPHAAPGQTFPVLIRVSAGDEAPVSLIITESLPPGFDALQGIPPISSRNAGENSIKWIHRMDAAEVVYGYLCRAPRQPLTDTAAFSGTVTLKRTVSEKKEIGGAGTVPLAPFHWADANRDMMIDDEEILDVYDTYSGLEELPLDRELIDSIWAGSGYRMDETTGNFIPLD
ncbi:MAG: helix-turn-helix domain-containing protein [Desulfobulbaceae bacterium]